jgi:cytochrome b involved in lipid metabolism
MPRGRHAWLARKAAHDSAAGATDALPPANTAQLWMVHGKWYDLEAFAARHPGGAFWITETRGMDITELYETHHLDMDGPDQILRKHLVRVQPCVSVACLAARRL